MVDEACERNEGSRKEMGNIIFGQDSDQVPRESSCIRLLIEPVRLPGYSLPEKSSLLTSLCIGARVLVAAAYDR